VSLFENITIRNLYVDRISGNGAAYTIVGLPVTSRTDDKNTVPIRGVYLENITVAHFGSPGQCVYANVSATNISPPLPRGAGCGGQEMSCLVNRSSARCWDDTKTRGLGMKFQAAVHDRTTLERCAMVRAASFLGGSRAPARPMDLTLTTRMPQACSEATNPIAAIDDGNHCYW
jgi:hypothetical protein